MIDMNTEDIEAFIFDLDGTLVDSMWIWEKIDIDYLAKYGYELPEELQKDIEGFSFTETAGYFKERFNISDSIEEIQSEWNTMAMDLYANKIKLKAGVKELLDYAKDNNIKMGIGTSNSRKLLEATIEANNIGSYFTTMRTSCEVNKGKPSPDIFLKVAEDLNVKASRCMVFEDTHAGVIAGKRANMKVTAIYDELSSEYRCDIENDSDYYLETFMDLSIK